MVNFFRKSSVTKDVPISEIFSDKYGGLETTATIRGGRFSEKYALEFQIPDDPTFGAGKLYRLDLGLYSTGLELAENSTAIPKVVAYKVNDVSQSGAGREISEGVGNKKSDDILVYTAQLKNYSSVEEVFNGSTNSGPNEIEYEPIQRTLFRKEKPYTTPMMMKKYGLQFDGGKFKGGAGAGRGEGISMSEEAIATNYGSKPDDLGLSFGGKENKSFSYTHLDYLMAQIPGPVLEYGGQSFQTHQLHPDAITVDTINPSTPILILTRDKDTKTEGGDASLYKIEPLENKSGDTLFIFTNQPGIYWGNRDVIDNETYGNEVTSANSIFEYVRGADEFVGENKKTEGEAELFGVGAVRFSNKLQRTGGQSCQMYTFWKQQDDDPVTYPSKAGGGPTQRQECLIAKKNIPLPIKFPARPNWDNQDENHFASTIEIDIYIESLEKAYVHKSAIVRTKLNGATANITVAPHDMITARRGIAICFSEEAPTGGQSFYDFVKTHAAANSDTIAHSYYTFGTTGGVVGQEGSTSGSMWSITPGAKAVMADSQGGTASTAKNFSGVLIVMTPEGPAIIPSCASGITKETSGWLIDDNTKDVQVLQDGVYQGSTALEDIVGKWISLVFKVTPDGWTCYGPGRQSSQTYVSHISNGIYKGQQHTSYAVDDGWGSTPYGPAQSSHSIMQIVDLGSDEIINDGTLFGSEVTDHYAMNNHYVSESNPSVRNGAEFGANSLQHWPKNLSIWTMNYKNDKNVGLGKDEFMEGPTSDTSSSVFIDSVRFNNFNFLIKNCSSKKYNPNASPLQIGSSSIWAGPDYPRVDNDLLTGLTGDFRTNAPVVLSFGFKNSADIQRTTTDSLLNFTAASDNNVWLLFNGYETANLGANEEIPDCNIRFGYSGGYNGELEGGATYNHSSHSLSQKTASGDGTTMNDFFIINVEPADLENEDSYYAGSYLTIRAGRGKDQTRKIMASEYKDADEHYLAVQPQFYNTGGYHASDNTIQSYLAITPHVFGNQFRNECIGAHRVPGQALHARVGDGSSHHWQKTMFTSRAHSINVTEGTPTHLLGDDDNEDRSDDSAHWDYPSWRWNDVGYSAGGVPEIRDVASTGIAQLANKAYGTATSATNSSITLASTMDNTTRSYNGMLIIIEGGTGAGQIREITNWDNGSGSSGYRATVNKNWDINPDNTSKYRVRAAPYVGGHARGPENANEFHANVSAGTHNNWYRKYSNSVTREAANGSPHVEATDLQGGDDNTARFESKWFDTSFSEKGGAEITSGDIVFDPHQYAINDANHLLQATSRIYSPIRRYDQLCIGSVGQTGQVELQVATLPSAFDLVGEDADITITSSTTVPAAIDVTIDRPVYSKLPTSINNFNRKGFAHFSISNREEATQVYKRENLAASVRVTEINNPQNGQITLTVDNAYTLSSDDDEEYIVYLYGQMATMNDAANPAIAVIGEIGDSYEPNPYSATGLKIISRDLANNTVTFLWDGKANNGDMICTYDNLPALMISPYRFWLYLVIDCTDETGQKSLNSRSYRSVSWMESNVNNMAGYIATGEALGTTYDHANVAGTLAARQNLGSTWNEFTFNDATVAGVPGAYINHWELTRLEKNSSLDCSTDYGFGAFNSEDNTGGYCGKHIFYKDPSESQTENIMKLPFIVTKGSIEAKQDLTLLLAFEDEGLPHTLTLKARNPADSTYDPAIYSVYWDDRPAHPTLSVLPDEKDAFVPTFRWETQDDDLWYGLLHIDNRNIPNQYHNMIGHIPLNEDRATTYGGIFFENGAGVKTASNGGTFSNTREGLAGWAKDFNGTSDFLQFADAINFATKPTSEMTLVIHAIPDARISGNSSNEYLIAKQRTPADSGTITDYEVYIDTAEKINAKITPASGTAVKLIGGTILSRDGQTPVSIIVTFDNNLKGGNMKLFVDGRLEDQSGLMDATGNINRWKTGQSINQGTGSFYVGCRATGATEQRFYNGKIEEIVIYNKCLYPVNPKLPEFKLDKPLREVEDGSPISYQCRLFLKDYHNIRGNRTLDVASSSPVSLSKAGFRLADT